MTYGNGPAYFNISSMTNRRATKKLVTFNPQGLSRSQQAIQSLIRLPRFLNPLCLFTGYDP